jgi:hypothetical protein
MKATEQSTYEFLIEVPHASGECEVAHVGLSIAARRNLLATYWGCGSGTHTTWIVAELAAEEEAWDLIPSLLRDTARVVPLDDHEPGSTSTERTEDDTQAHSDR